MVRTFIAVACALATLGKALAADLPLPGPVPVAPSYYYSNIAPLNNWGGFI